MIKVGLTGGIGSGKTLICKVFEQLKVPVFYADIEAKKLLDNDSEIINQLKERFGNEIFDKKDINKARLASVIFSDTKALNDVNQIIHPKVRKNFSAWANQQNSPYVVMEAAILFESGGYEMMDYNILVYAPEKLRVERVMKRDNISEEQVRARMRNQKPDEDKIDIADWVIHNDGSQMVLPQVIEIHESLKEKV